MTDIIDELVERGYVREYSDGSFRWLANPWHKQPGSYYRKPPQAHTFASDDATKEAGRKGGNRKDGEVQLENILKVLGIK